MHRALANAELTLERFDAAEAGYRAALALDPDDPETLAASAHLPTAAALDPLSTGNGGPAAAPGFTIQWWYKVSAPTTFGYLWGHLFIDPMLVRTAYDPDGNGD